MTAAVLIAGDIHGDAAQVVRLLTAAQRWGCDRIIACGDVGFVWGDTGLLEAVSTVSYSTGITWDMVDGNHEDYDLLASPLGATPDDTEPAEIAPHVTYRPRGTQWDIDGVRFGAFGGAISVDRGWCNPDSVKPWWPAEAITEPQVERACRLPPVDVMVTHDTPQLTNPLDRFMERNRIKHPDRWKKDRWSNRNRELLHQVYRAWQPSIAFHGHYHHSYEAMGEHGTVVGLACNGMPNSFYPLDLDTVKDRR